MANSTEFKINDWVLVFSISSSPSSVFRGSWTKVGQIVEVANLPYLKRRQRLSVQISEFPIPLTPVTVIRFPDEIILISQIPYSELGIYLRQMGPFSARMLLKLSVRGQLIVKN